MDGRAKPGHDGEGGGNLVRLVSVARQTGPLGQQIVAQALERGHEVTALARNPARLTIAHANLRVVQGDEWFPVDFWSQGGSWSKGTASTSLT